jgi:ATP citrate (pro-S)-lyase
VEKHERAVCGNFASFRFVPSSLPSRKHETFRTRSRLSHSLLKRVPESQTRALNEKAQNKNVCIIGPAIVGRIKPRYFQIRNTCGMLDKIAMSKLYRPGSVAYVCIQKWQHVQRAQQYHLPKHRWRIQGRSYWGRAISGISFH